MHCQFFIVMGMSDFLGIEGYIFSILYLLCSDIIVARYDILAFVFDAM